MSTRSRRANPAVKAASRRERLPAELSRVNFGAAGVDVGAGSHFVAVPESRCPQPVHEYASFTADLYRLAELSTPRRNSDECRPCSQKSQATTGGTRKFRYSESA